MKVTRPALALVAMALAIRSDAQGWITLSSAGTDVTNGVINDELPGNTGNLLIPVTAVTTIDRLVNVKRYELNVVTGTQNYFCWHVCYLPQDAGTMPVWVAADPHELLAGVPFEGFAAHHVANGILGVMGYRYVWYDVNTPSDSASVEIWFDNTTGLQEVAGAPFFLLSPNPADEVMNVQLRPIAGSADALVVYDALGAQ